MAAKYSNASTPQAEFIFEPPDIMGNIEPLKIDWKYNP